jgi:hypothetical protein
MKCEICEGRPVATCAGLDVPEVYFCKSHAEDHEQTCVDIKAGRSSMYWHLAWRELARLGGTAMGPNGRTYR